ncbi:MAG: hypothetical protein QG670_1373 [Thermoproteota archaeon]|nr:hypothetical protein [Thermoproteota archaeon]
MSRKAVLICLDGCGIDYLNSALFLRRLSIQGYFVEGNSIIPSVTNVNNVSIITGEYPDVHGITSNYYYDRGTGKEVYMESPSFIKTQTLLEWASKKGLQTALLTAKDKLRTLIGKGAKTSFSAEKPEDWVIKKIGEPPNIYSVDINLWLFKAAKEVILKEAPDFTYIATTDYAMHKYAPQESESNRHIRGIDQSISEISEIFENNGTETLICVTADHGMSKISTAVNLELILKEHSINSKMNTIIADRYIVHHGNLGGAAYLYLEDIRNISKSIDILKDTNGVERAFTREEASKLYHLDPNRIGDILALGEKGWVFGLQNEVIKEVNLRSHGSLNEMKIPIITNLSKSESSQYPKENKDLASLIKEWLEKGISSSNLNL